MKKRLLSLLILITLLVIIVVLLLLRPKPQEMLGLEPANTILMSTDKECDVSVSTCQASLGEYRLKFSIDSTVQPLKSFTVELQPEAWQPEQAAVYFSMQGMEMGLNRFSLQQTDGVWQGRAMLPVCTDRRSDWLATVFVSHDGQRYRSEFGFSTD